VGSKTLHQQNHPVLNWRCRRTQVDLYNGRKTVVVVVVVVLPAEAQAAGTLVQQQQVGFSGPPKSIGTDDTIGLLFSAQQKKSSSINDLGVV